MNGSRLYQRNASEGYGRDSPDEFDPHMRSGTEDEDDDDNDEGMFSYARPNTGQRTTGSASQPQSVARGHEFAATSRVPPGPFQFDLQSPSDRFGSIGSSQEHSAMSPPQVTPVTLSPAAAYALANFPPTLASGPRKRTSFSPDSPSHDIHNPYENHGGTAEEEAEEEDRRQASSLSSRDKIEMFDSNWAPNANVAYARTPDGQMIMLNEIGEPIRLATSREQKMLADFGMENYVSYQAEPDLEEEEEEDSPYAEVRASVSNIDDPEMPVLTFRAWFIGLTFCMIIAALNCFFILRYPAPLVTPVLTQILSYPLGKLLARILPIQTFRLPRIAERLGLPAEFSFNPGPFNIKEHALIVIMANVSTAPAAGVAFSLASEKYYATKQSAGFDILLILTTQMIGFGIAGLCRRFLVWPAGMIWPQNLVFCTLLNTLHAEDEDEGQGVSRFRFFLCVLGGAFAWYWLPGFLFTALSAFSWVCWIAPNNVVVNQLFGVSSGLGMGVLTFDWSQIAYLGSPLIVPWWAEVNIFCGFALAFWVIAPIMYYTNVWDSAYLPISTSQVFDRFGSPYNTSAVVDPITLALNETAYQAYSPLYLPITYATTYGLAFMLSVAVIVHTVLYHGKSIGRQLRQARVEDHDVHMKLMRNYPEVPDWWYLIFVAVALALSIVAVVCFDTQTPAWALVVAVLVGFLYVLPVGIVFAMTSTQVSINLIVELIAGYAIPGRPLANMIFKVYSTQTVSGGLFFIQDLKLGHYMKIPPRATFAAQMLATALTSFVQVGVKRWLVARVPDLCDSRQHFLLTCPTVRVYYSASVIWGLIGPARQFAIGRLYNPILYWLLAGAILPAATWLISRYFPHTPVKYVNVPVALAGAIFMPPATGINFSSWFLVGFVFQYLLRRHRFRWWSKFNFVLSAGLDSGTVLAGLLIFLTLSLPKNGQIVLNWWGNDVYTKTLDWAGTPFKTPPPEGFGRTSW